MWKLLSQLRQGTTSLKTVLAVYFIPISIIPVILISLYAGRVLEETTKDTLLRRASSERGAILGEIDNLETELFQQVRAHSAQRALGEAIALRDEDAILDTIRSFRTDIRVRVYTLSGEFLIERNTLNTETPIAYVSREGLRRVKALGETLNRHFSVDTRGFVSTARVLVKFNNQPVGILEEERHYGVLDLADLKHRREIDIVILTREFNVVSATFALPQSDLKSVSQMAAVSSYAKGQDPLFVRLGDSRYAAFLFDFPAHFRKQKNWGYFALFLPMGNLDFTVGKLKFAMVVLTAVLIGLVLLLTLLVSKQLVRPIELLVLAMKRVKSGRVEQIPPLETATYELEYLVRSFNDMARSISGAKKALELKLEELHRANNEIKRAQTTLVQSAKMASLGNLVAGVAHELNNPIGFIYSNMHHLAEYLAKIRNLVATYRRHSEKLPKNLQGELKKLEKELEIDFILQDMEDLTRSCVDGAKRTKDIVLGLRTFSRMDDSGVGEVDIHEGILGTIKLLSTEVKDRVEIIEEFEEIPLIECNLSQVNQVFMNLISNAAQAISSRGKIWVRTKRVNEKVLIEIQDTGSGMSPEVLEKIFDPFFTTKKVGQGTGLGLSIAYGLIEKHHGTITVKSTLGQGTLFTITLPIRQPVAQAG